MKYYVYMYQDPRKSDFYFNTGTDPYFGYYQFEPFYIGKGKGRRIKQHLWEARTPSANKYNQHKLNKIQEIINSGKQVIVVKLKEFDTEKEAFDFEKKLIRQIGRYPNGPLTNMTDGGDGISGYKHTREWKEKLSKWNKEHPLSTEVRKYISSCALKGKNHQFYGTHRSEETKRKISLKNSGQNNGMYGYKPTEEERKKQSERFSGKKNPMYGTTGEKGTNSQWEYTFHNQKTTIVTRNLLTFCKENNLNYKYIFKCFSIKRFKYKGWNLSRKKYETNI